MANVDIMLILQQYVKHKKVLNPFRCCIYFVYFRLYAVVIFLVPVLAWMTFYVYGKVIYHFTVCEISRQFQVALRIMAISLRTVHLCILTEHMSISNSCAKPRFSLSINLANTLLMGVFAFFCRNRRRKREGKLKGGRGKRRKDK